MKRRPSKAPLSTSTSTVETTVIYDAAAILREGRKLVWTLFCIAVIALGSPTAVRLLNSKPAVALAQYMVGEMEKPRPDGGALSGRAKRPHQNE